MGLQAQEPLDPYTALWSRLRGFRPAALGRLLERREAVRIAVMRVDDPPRDGRDCLALRPLMQPVLDAELARHPRCAAAAGGVDLAPVLRSARQELRGDRARPRELRRASGRALPGHDAAALGCACRCLLALVQVPPRGVWGRTRRRHVATAEAWLGGRSPGARRSTTSCSATWRPSGRRPPADARRLVAPRHARGVRAAAAATAHLPRRAWPRAARPARRAAARPGRRRRRRASSPSTTTSCSRTPTAPASSPPRRGPGCRAPPGIGWGSVLVDGRVPALWRLEGREAARGRRRWSCTPACRSGPPRRWPRRAGGSCAWSRPTRRSAGALVAAP